MNFHRPTKGWICRFEYFKKNEGFVHVIIMWGMCGGDSDTTFRFILPKMLLYYVSDQWSMHAVYSFWHFSTQFKPLWPDRFHVWDFSSPFWSPSPFPCWLNNSICAINLNNYYFRIRMDDDDDDDDKWRQLRLYICMNIIVQFTQR